MGKEPPMTRQGTRYEPYSGSFLTHRRRGSPPPDSRGIRAESHRARLNGSIIDLLEDLNTRYGGGGLREVFRGHANQPGTLGQAIKSWIQYDEIRGPRQPELTDHLKTGHNNQSNWSSVQEPIPGDESRKSRPRVGQPDARHISPPHQFSEHPNAPTTDENYLQRSRRAPLFHSTSPGERLFADPPNSPCTNTVPTSQATPYSHPESATSPYGDHSNHWPWCIPKAVDLCEDVQRQGEEHGYRGEPSLSLAASRSREGPLFTTPNDSPSRRAGDEVQMSRGQRYPTSHTRTDSHTMDSPPLGSLPRITRGVAAPPLVSLPPVKEPAVHGSSNRSEGSLINGPNEQDCISRRNSDESVHAAFWETAGWTPETGYPGFSEEGYRIPAHLKAKGRGRLQGPNEGGQAPEEQGFSGWNPPQPGNPIYGIPFLVSTTSRESVPPRTPIKIEPQDEGSIPIALHQEQGEQDTYEHEQPPAQLQPPPRRSARIKAMNNAVPPKVKTPAKSTGRKRAVRKK